MTTIVRDEINGRLVAGSTLSAGHIAVDSEEALEASPLSGSPTSDNSSTPLMTTRNSTLGASQIGQSYRKSSFIDRLRRLVRLPHHFPEGYTTELWPTPIIPSLDSYQQGYGKVAAIETCEPSFTIYRKFGWLHNRALLHSQDELSELEQELQELDRYDFTDGDPTRLISRRHDYGILGAERLSERKELIKRINAKLEEYDELLLRTQQILAMKRPTKKAQRSLFNHIKNTQSLVKKESLWVRHTVDLAALSLGTEHGWFNDFLEDLLNGISLRLTRLLLTSDEERQQEGKEVVELTSPTRRDIFLRVILTVLASILLLVPVFILIRLQPSHATEVSRKSNFQFLVVFLFTLLFSASFSIFTRARRHEVFAGTAAYCAVLVIFLGNTSNVVTANALMNEESS